MSLALSLILIVGVPGLMIGAAKALEPFGIAKWWLVGISLLMGAVSFTIAYVIERNELASIGSPSYVGIALIVAPALEEFLKLATLLVFYNRGWARYSGDGLVYGFSIGAGFAILENLEYVSNNPEQAFGMAILRVMSAGLLHCGLSAVVGTAVGGVMYYRRWLTYPFFVILYLNSVIVHYLYNIGAFLSPYLGDPTFPVVYGAVVQFIVLGLLVFIRYREPRRILHEAAASLSPLELVLVRHGPDMLDRLNEQANVLGSAQVQLLQELLASEAQIALLSHHIVKDKGRRRRIHQLRREVHDLRMQTRRLRRDLSPEALRWLKTVGIPSRS